MTDRASALRAAVHEACFGRSEPSELTALLARHGVTERDAAYLVSAPRRLPLYRKLVRGNVRGVATAILERTFAHAERAAPGAFDAAIDAYLEQGGPSTPHLRDVPVELGAVLVPRFRGEPRMPGYVADLAQLEIAEFRVGAAPDAPLVEAADVSPEKPVLLRGPYERLTCDHGVTSLTTAELPAPAAGPERSFVYRDSAHVTHVLVLTPFAAALLARLDGGEPLGASIAGAAAELSVALSPALLDEVARWLSDFGARGILLGAPA